MARTPTPKQPAATPEPFDPSKLMGMVQDIQQTMDTLIGRTLRTETIAGQLLTMQADAEKRMDDRIVARLAPLQLRVISTTEKALEALQTLTAEIKASGNETREEIARTAEMAKILMRDTETAVSKYIRAMKDEVERVASTAQDSVTKTIETIRQEASTMMEGMRDAAVENVDSLGAQTAIKLQQVEVLATNLIGTTAQTAKDEIRRAALAAEDGVKKVTEGAQALADQNVAAAATFERCMADLKKAGNWLAAGLERRTWQITRATGLHTAVSIGLGAALYQGLLWVLSTHH